MNLLEHSQNERVKLLLKCGYLLKTVYTSLSKFILLFSRIVVTLNVNHTVDSSEPDDGTEEAPEMKSMPNFEVDIAKDDGRTLSFSCSYLSPDEETPSSPEEQFDDVFAIDEVTMFDGEEWSEKKYAVAGDILDGNLYDLFMGMLDERGIDKQFAERLSTYCSAYEHGLYIKMLQDLQKFAK